MLNQVMMIILVFLLLNNYVYGHISKDFLSTVLVKKFERYYEKRSFYVYDPEVVPPWGMHTDVLKGEAVFVNHESMELALPYNAEKATIRIDLKHCRKSVEDKGRKSCFCYKVNTDTVSEFELQQYAEKCQSREMAPICHDPDTKKVTFISNGRLVTAAIPAANDTEIFTEFTFDITKGEAFIRETPVLVPAVKKMYRVGTPDQIDVIEFKTPGCLHIEFENLIYTGSLVRSTPFPRPTLPNQCRAGCVCKNILDVDNKEILIDTSFSSTTQVKYSYTLYLIAVIGFISKFM